MSNDLKYIGRTQETNLLIKELNSALVNSNVHTLVYIEGFKGIGKKTLLQQAWDSYLLQIPKPLRIPVYCDQSEKTQLFLDSISKELDSREPSFSPIITAFRKDYSQSLKENTETAAIADNQKQMTLSDDMLVDLWVECFFRHFVRQPDNSKGLQIVFEFYDFEQLQEPLKDLLFRLLIHPLADQKVNPEIRFFLTGEDSLSKLKSYANGWNVFSENSLEIKLSPFSESEVIEWVKEKELPQDIATRLYQESDGIPGKLSSLSDKIVDEEHSDDWLAQAQKILDDFNPNQQTMLCQAALLPIITEVNLTLFVDEKEASTLMQLLPGNAQLKLKQTESGLRLAKEIQRSLQVWYQKKYPQQFRQDTIKAASFQEVALLLPTANDRKVLQTLYNFNYFNHEVLSEIYGAAEATLLMEYVNRRHSLFEHTKDNHRISSSTRRILDSFYDASSYNPNSEEIQRISAAWQKRRDEILNGKNKTEERIVKQESSINTLKKEIRKIQTDLTDRKDKLERIKKRNETQSTQRSNHSAKMGGSALMLISGIALLYIGIFFSDTLPLIYAIIGLILTFASVFFAKRLRPQTTPTRIHTPQINTEGTERSMQFLNLKKNQLQVKLGAFTSNIQRYKGEIIDFEAQLREPYN